MWPFKKKSISIKPGEIKDLFFDIPEDKEIFEIILNYENENGNKYESRVLVNFKKKKRQKVQISTTFVNLIE
jgi:hypothetical protein